MRSVADALQSIAVTLWVGGMWVTGFVVAPLLFARLGDRALAGMMAGRFFSTMAWIGIACAAYLVAYRCSRFRLGCLRQAVFWIVVLMLALVLAGHFGIQPVMEALRAQALPAQVMESVLRDRFLTWHGVSSALYVLQSLLGLALVVLHGKGK